VISLVEGLVTFFLFFVLLGLAYCADRVHARRQKDRDGLKYGQVVDASVNPEAGNMVRNGPPLARGAIVPPIPFTAFEVYNHLIPEERGKVWATPEQRATS